ncbi:MAG: hypothetical protein V4438_04290 [Patescibacteria group bacterium]
MEPEIYEDEGDRGIAAGTCAPINLQTSNSIKLYEAAAAAFNAGRSLVPPNYSKMLGCAISINTLYRETFGHEIGGEASTYQFWQAIKNSNDFIQVQIPLPGDIIISPTGTQPSQSPLRNGHVGVVAKFGILSNNSANGLFQEHYTLGSWADRYVKLGGFPIFYFRAV